MSAILAIGEGLEMPKLEKEISDRAGDFVALSMKRWIKDTQLLPYVELSFFKN